MVKNMKHEILRLEHIGKTTNGQLLHSISMNLYQGEALCVITEDLDTKLYLLDILQGNVLHEHGTLYINDCPTHLSSSEESRNKGLYLVTESQLIFSMNVAHNLYMTNSSFYSSSILNNQAIHQAARTLLKAFSLDYIKTTTLVRALSEFDRYLLSILYGVAANAKIIVLDTPYITYRPAEIRKLQHIVNVLRAKGLSVLWFTSKWDMLFQNFDRYAIIKNGVITKLAPLTTLPPHTFSPHIYQWNSSEATPVVLEYTTNTATKHMAESPAHFALHEGEILGIHGTNTLLENMISDLLSGKSNHLKDILLYGQPYDLNFSKKNLIAFIYATDDKSRVFPQMSLYDNITLLINTPLYNPVGIINKRIRNHIAISMLKSIHGEQLIKSFGDRNNIIDMCPLDRLKVEVAKWLCMHPKVFIFVNPHNIYDNLTESDFHTLLDDLHKLDISILILSGSEENLSGICTRVISE